MPPLGVALATTVVFSMVRRGVMVSASAGAVLVRQHMGHLQAREMVKIWPFEIDHMISIKTMNAMGGSAELKITKPPGSRMNERATTSTNAPVSLLSWSTSSRSCYPQSYCARCSPSRRPPCHCRRQVETNVYHESSEIKSTGCTVNRASRE